MGSIFIRKPLKESNPLLVEYLKSKKITDINNVVEVLDCSYQLQQSLNYEEFQDAFIGYLNEYIEAFFIQLESSHSLEGQVDVYESLAVLTIFSQAHYDEKLKYLFALFDFDKSKMLQKQELLMVYQTGVRALCKLVNIQLPTFKELEAFSECAFTYIDKDNNKSISEEEFREFMNTQPDLQDFLLRYAQIQTNNNALRRFNESFTKYQKCYSVIKGDLFVKAGELKERLQKHLKDDTDFVIQILTDTSQFYDQNLPPGLVLKSAYDDIMKAWSSFEATDINDDHQLNLKELEFLLYTYEGEEPSTFRIKNDMEQLDKDKSGQVSKREWMNFLCVSKESLGKMVLRGSLKQKFKQYDIDNSGCLDRGELRKMMMDTFKEVEGKFNQNGKQQYKEYQDMIYSLCDQFLQGINKNGDDDQEVREFNKQFAIKITWMEFKEYLEVGLEKIEQLKEYIRKL